MNALLFVQDTAAKNSNALSQVSSPPRRTPENIGFMESAYTVAALLYGGYLLLMFRRWTALRTRQKQLNSRTNAD